MLTIQCGIVLFVYGYPTFQIDVHYYVCPKGCVVVLRVIKLCGGLGTISRLGSFGMQLLLSVCNYPCYLTFLVRDVNSCS